MPRARAWIAAAAMVCALPSTAAATTIPVNTTADVVSGTDGACSFREAVTAANGNMPSGAAAGECPAGSSSVADEIDLGAGTFAVSSPIGLSTDMTVRGQGDANAATTVLDAGGTGRVLGVTGGTVTIRGVTVTGGHAADGVPGADHAGGTGRGEDGGQGTNGGGILNSSGALTLVDDRIVANTSGAGGKGGKGTGDLGGPGGAGAQGRGGWGGYAGLGGGVANGPGATLVVRNSLFSLNHAGVGGSAGDGLGGHGGAGGDAPGGQGVGGIGRGGGYGGAIYSQGALTVSDTTFADNAAGDGGKGGDGTGGGGAQSGVGGDGHGGNGGNGGWGGAIFSSGASDIRTSAFARNSSGRGGDGAVGHGDPGLSGFGGNAFGGAGGAAGRGGGIAFQGAPSKTQTLVDVTIAQNSAGAGGAGGDAHKGFNATTIKRGAGGDGGPGGGLSHSAGTVTVAHATISGNSAGAAGPGGSGPGPPGTQGAPGQPGTGPGTFTISGAATKVQNSVLADPCAGVLTDQGHNLGVAGCVGAAGDPMLGPLADNGGPTFTMALGAGSAALDQVPATGAGCAPTDQRGAVRPGGPLCDIGAYEIAPPLATTGDASGVGESAASLNGTVEGRGLATSYHFEYGLTADYGSSSPPGSTSAAAGAPVGAALSGLTPSTTYHFRLVASSHDGSSTGADNTFTTTAPGTGNPGPDVTAPVVDQVTVKPKRFAARKGTTFGYRVSEAAGATLAIERGRAGLKLKGRCGAASARRRRAVVAQIKRRLGSKATPRRIARELRKARCTVYAGAGALQQLAVAGTNTLHFSGRIGTKALKRGGYRLKVTARDAAGNVSKPAFGAFTVTR